jgi:uncharacterized protein with gpF-like domain
MKDVIWKAHDKARFKSELRLTNTMKAYIGDIKKEVLDKLEQASKSLTVDNIIFDVQEWVDEIKRVLGPQAAAMMMEAFNAFVRENAIDGVVFEPTDRQVLEGIRQIVDKTTSVPQTLHDSLLSVLEENIRLNNSPAEIAANISSFFDSTTNARAIRVAQTVSNYVVNKGNAIAAKQAGIFKKKLWLTQRDARVRNHHRSLDGETVPIDAEFKLTDGDALSMPGDPKGRAENVIRCRCTAIYLID